MVDKPLYLTRIEGPPPKRNVVCSSHARGAIVGAAFALLKNSCLFEAAVFSSELMRSSSPNQTHFVGL